MGGRADRATWVSWLPPTRKRDHILTLAKEPWTFRENAFPDWCISGACSEPPRLQTLSPFGTLRGFSGQRLRSGKMSEKSANATSMRHQCDIKVTPKRVDSQAIGTPLRPQSYPKATPMRPQCDPNATPKPPPS